MSGQQEQEIQQLIEDSVKVANSPLTKVIIRCSIGVITTIAGSCLYLGGLVKDLNNIKSVIPIMQGDIKDNKTLLAVHETKIAVINSLLNRK